MPPAPNLNLHWRRVVLGKIALPSLRLCFSQKRQGKTGALVSRKNVTRVENAIMIPLSYYFAHSNTVLLYDTAIYCTATRPRSGAEGLPSAPGL